LRNVVGRVESSWRPATAEEGFEIVRRRLFEPLAGTDAFKQRDVTARAFADLYHAQAAEFPPECRGADYERRIQAAYPIHPEIFDRLYTDWSTLVKFQRTRGVLRLMAAVIHSLWEKGDRNPLILPSTIPIDDGRVQSELTRYLSDNWVPIIEKDVDGAGSLPLKIDSEQPNLGKLHATRRVARTIYLGSARPRRLRVGPRRPASEPRLRNAGGATRHIRRRTAPSGGSCDLPLPGRDPRLVRDATYRNETRGGSCRTVEARAGQDGEGARGSAALQPAKDRGLLAHPPIAAFRCRRAGRSRCPPRGTDDRALVQ